MKQNNYDMPWRPTYEALAASGWGAALLGTIGAASLASIPSSYALYMGTASAVGLILRGSQAKRHWDFKVALSGRKFYVLPMDNLIGSMKEGKLWLGKGWEWKPMHTQRCYEALKRDVSDFLPPNWYLKLKKIPLYKDVVGQPWIHGLNNREDDIQVDLDALEGHTLVMGTTGAGKTRLLETVTTQYILNAMENGGAVIIIDPKGDKELAEIARTACAIAGQPDKFVSFHPAFPASSIRFDPLKNWTRKTQIASRIAMLMTGGGGNDSFVQFAWRAINMVAEGLLYIGIRPNLKLIKRYVAGGPDELMQQVLEHFFDQNVPNWGSSIQSLIAEASKGKFPTKLNPASSPELIAYVHFYKNMVDASLKNESVNSLLELTEHPREHYGKVIANILPILQMLTTDDLGDMLSPDANNFEDPRPIFDSSKIIEGGYVLYMGLDSLSDATVGSALAGIALADLAAKAGEIYNYGDTGKSKRRITLIVDESAEVVNQPLIQLLNKGRGSGFVIWLLTQTFPDFIAKMGSEPMARQILGNCNNLIALRVVDSPTQQYIAERFGQTHIAQTNLAYSGASRTEDSGVAHTGSVSQTIAETMVDVVPQSVLGRLPAMNYIALVAGGRMIKGRLPKITLN
ncbi:conjugative transfer system coupling protein TraD [Crenobacter sp. SG2305]|uniref:conjugative transfer system coupling protein TraD n=1 Tax=Crenobacter oryzisoli TaxID=3056844 RepID=UPI0025AADC9E|nr:conjugative transfer system coupling protein TraD [Crenobacter sp. SG2305]MDN0082495.1 conjugative transfer system coupling protein TraD [Crenobacter sp. SG2305]